jgi:spore coat polysaccharide biosynthesis protein SpsF (cytidylyltransferase family)
MNEYSFEVGVRAIVRVEASNPDLARKVIESVLGAPGSQEIELANRNNQGLGRDATVTSVDFVQKTPAKLVADEAKLVATKRRGQRTA